MSKVGTKVVLDRLFSQVASAMVCLTLILLEVVEKSPHGVVHVWCHGYLHFLERFFSMRLHLLLNVFSYLFLIYTHTSGTFLFRLPDPV